MSVLVARTVVVDSDYCKDSLCHSHPLSSSSSVLLPTLPVGELVHVHVRRCSSWERV